jgi:hypothetical protein
VARIVRRGDAPGMAITDSTLTPEMSTHIRSLLTPRPRKDRMWPVLSAAAFAAACALSFATAMILAPPVVSRHVAQSAE